MKRGAICHTANERGGGGANEKQNNKKANEATKDKKKL